MNKRPRLSVFRSNKYIYAQIIDDEKGRTLVAASEKDLPMNRKRELQKARRKLEGTQKRLVPSLSSGPSVIKGISKTERARLVGEILAKKALEKGIKKVRFDRRKYRYHGQVKALAEEARKGGLKF